MDFETAMKELDKVIVDIEDENIAFTYGDTQNQVEMINADNLHIEDFTGEGITIAVMDSGFPNVNTMGGFQRLRDNGDLLNGYDFVDRIVVVDIPEELQLERTHQRDKTDIAQIKRIIASQLPREARLLKATEIINNTGDLNQLQAQVVALHMRYQELANDRHKTN